MLTWLEIDSDALNHNVEQIKQRIGPTNAFAAVIKSNAYGHGMLTIAKLLEHNTNVDFFCCATLSEAQQLRAAQIHKPIIVFGVINGNPAEIDEQIEFFVDDLDTIYWLNQLGSTHQRMFKIHLKIDTGLSRFGIFPDQTMEMIITINQLPYIHLSGICTHFIQSQEEDRSCTENQLQQFNSIIELCRTMGTMPQWIHVANSAAALTMEQSSCNLFRIGLALYGHWSSSYIKKITQHKHPFFNLMPVLSWKTRIIKIKEIPAYTTVGYLQTFIATRNTRIGILPIGFFDGYDIRLSNRTVVKVNNQYAPIIGRICMNLCLIDITDIKSAKIDTLVTLIGTDQPINIETISDLLDGENCRVFLSRIAGHIPRVAIHQAETTVTVTSSSCSSLTI